MLNAFHFGPVAFYSVHFGLGDGVRTLAQAPRADAVARITEDARAITETNLSARLAVPDSNDELQQLPETLNAMLERIEWSFTRTKQFTADSSHELRATMTLIDTAAQYSLSRERSREELVDSTQRILHEALRTTALVDDLLLVASGNADRETADLELMDAGPVRANEARRRRLLLILVDNALKLRTSQVASQSKEAGIPRRSQYP